MMKKLFHIFWHLTLAVYVLGQTGFTSIDCGSEELKYDDPSTGISFTSDSIYIEAGVNNVIGDPSLPKPYQTIRSFPTGKRNCYSLEGVNIGDKYLVRASFMYGNYDGLNKLPEFDIYLGVDLWLSVKFDNSSHMLWSEILIAATTTSIDVCLINKDSGTPFISILEFRRWRSAMYNPIFEVNSVLVTLKRVDTGSSKAFRYPEDSYDRIWSPDSSSMEEHPSWKILTSTNDVNGTLDEFDVPKAVMQTAVESNSSKYHIDISWSGNPSSEFHVVGYFSELVDGLNLSREISIYINNEVPFSFVLPTFGETYVDYSLSPLSGLSNHTYSVTATNIAPLLNAFEIFQIRQLSRLATSLEDVSAIMSIKQRYDIRRNWKGDPCLPKDYPWIGLGCNYDNATNPRIISLDLSMSNLTGDISDILSTLTAIKSINLANNSLRGSIPDSLGDLPNLEYLYLEGNQLNGAIPEKLKERINNGTLKLRIDDHTLISKKSHRGLVVGIVIIAAVSLIVLVVVILAIKLKIRKQGDETGEDDGGEKNSEFSLFSFAMVEAATDNFSFENKLGEGGFGPVYKGVMPDGQEIAVKRLSQSSGQGTVEFKNEAELTATLQHRNLVRLLGYCTHGEEKILIYEYMPNRSLDSFLFDPNKSALLDWTKRLNIIIGIARGILYLHEDSRLRIIHRDLKSSNILLDAEMSPKISDFGMARSFGRHQTQENTRNVVGTFGYMSPEYALRGFFSEKSDIFSFGVLVLEIVSGKKCNGFYNESLSLIGYGWQLWKEGRATEFMDPCLGDSYPMWEVLRCIHIGLLCVQESPGDRPNMSSILFMLSSETDLVPPEKPAFSILSEADLSSIQQKTGSANNVTVTAIEAR